MRSLSLLILQIILRIGLPVRIVASLTIRPRIVEGFCVRSVDIAIILLMNASVVCCGILGWSCALHRWRIKVFFSLKSA